MIRAKIIQDDDKTEYSIILGGDPRPKRWRAYRSMWIDPRYITAVKNVIIDDGLVGEFGMNISEKILFKFSDNHKPYGFSIRAWGDLMDAIIGKKQGYMAYY